MGYLLYHILTSVPSLTETSKKNIVKYGFVKRLDEILMKYYYPRTWSKRKRDLQHGKEQDDDNESAGESEVGIGDSNNDTNQFDDVENGMDDVPGTTAVGENYAMTQELKGSLEEWTIRDPDSPELLNYHKQCAILLTRYMKDFMLAKLNKGSAIPMDKAIVSKTVFTNNNGGKDHVLWDEDRLQAKFRHNQGPSSKRAKLS